MNVLPSSQTNVVKVTAVVAVFLALFSAAPLHAQDFSNVLALLGPDQERLAWEINADVVKDLGQLDALEPLDARILGNALLTAALREKDGGDKKKCCYEKVADGVWSCCDGTFVTTGARSLGKLFDLAGKSPEKDNGEKDLSEKFRPFLIRFNRGDAFKSLGLDDPKMHSIPWEKMESSRRADGL